MLLKTKEGLCIECFFLTEIFLKKIFLMLLFLNEDTWRNTSTKGICKEYFSDKDISERDISNLVIS